MLRAKRPSSFVSSQPDPSPPSDMGSSCGAESDPQPTRWWWIIVLIVAFLGLAFVGFCVYFAYYSASDDAHSALDAVTAFLGQTMQLEDMFSDTFREIMSCVTALATNLFLHGGRYFKVLLLASTGYSGCILVIQAFCSLRTRRAPRARVDRGVDLYTLIWVCILAGICASSYLSWIAWVPYYSVVKEIAPFNLEEKIGRLSTRVSDQLASLVGWGAFSATERFVSAVCFDHFPFKLPLQMILGPAVAQCFVMTLSLVCLVLVSGCSYTGYNLRTVFIMIRRRPYWPAELILEIGCVIASLAIAVVTIHSVIFYQEPVSKHILSGYSFLSRGWRRGMWQVFWTLWSEHIEWKDDHMARFWTVISVLRDSFCASFQFCGETWHTSPPVQRVLIVTPTAIYYFYFCIIPKARRFLNLIRRWRRR
ncbi:hypothetical protein C8R43DRAFT_1005247, partial [Mycena crocata]